MSKKELTTPAAETANTGLVDTVDALVAKMNEVRSSGAPPGRNTCSSKAAAHARVSTVLRLFMAVASKLFVHYLQYTIGF